MTASAETLPYPRFSDAEMARRRESLAAELEAAGAAHAVLYGANKAGPAIGWLTRWPVTREALCVFTPGEQDLLLVNFYNHIPNAERIATEAEVRWAGPSPMATAIGELERRGARGSRVAVIGPLGYKPCAALASFALPVPLDDAYTRLRLRKSAEELAWLRAGCGFTDDAVRAVHEQAGPGTDERELGNLAERAYVGRGGMTHIHYFGEVVPAQWPAARELARGDVLSCEVSASYWDYPGQLLRTFTVAADPPPLYRELHDVADAAFDSVFGKVRPGATAADLVEASGVIEDAGFTTRDDLVHGFVGGYLPPVLGDRSRTLEEVPDFTLEDGMTIVIQPNVVTPDES
ncbi:MAG TPA: M24 family metallopeptidase, partial [Thermoleophilaceae bacterium]|nr:M24 family metallopeptidase [Thermoleophilaceae bacterium]